MEKSFHFIYKTTCVTTGQYYVGRHSTNNLNDFYLGSGVRLKPLIGALGKDKFKRVILAMADDLNSCKVLERQMVTADMLNDPNCLNAIPGGGGQGKLSPETKQKISQANKGRAHTSEARARMSEGQLGKQFSDETKRKMSESRRGLKHSEATKEKIAAIHKGAKRSDVAKQNIAAAQAGKTLSLEHRAKISASNIGKNAGKTRVMPEETRKKISQSTTGRKISEETRLKMASAAKIREQRKKELKE